MLFSTLINSRTKWDMLLIFLVGMGVRSVFLYLFPVPYGEDAFGRLYFKDEIFLAHWLPLTQVIVYLCSLLTWEVMPVRIVFAILGSLAGCGFYCFLKGIVERKVALQGGLLFSVNALFMQLSLMPYQDVPFLGFLYASLACLLPENSKTDFLSTKKRRIQSAKEEEGIDIHQTPAQSLSVQAVVGAILLGLACLTRYESWFLLPFFVLWEFKTLYIGIRRRLPLAALRVLFFYGWAPLLWFALSWMHYGAWDGFLFQTQSGEFYAFNPHLDVRWMVEYGAQTLYWLGLYGSPLILLSAAGVLRLQRLRQPWHPRLRFLVLLTFLVSLFFFMIIGKGQATVFRFSAIPLSVLLVFVVVGWEVLSQRSNSSRPFRNSWRSLLSSPIAFAALLMALVVYSSIPLARLNSDPEFRDPYQVAGILRNGLDGQETAMIVAPSTDDPSEAAPIAYQRVAAQSGSARERIQSARLIDVPDGQALLDSSRRTRVKILVLFEGYVPRVPAENFYAQLVKGQPDWIKLSQKLVTARIYTISTWPETLESEE